MSVLKVAETDERLKQGFGASMTFVKQRTGKGARVDNNLQEFCCAGLVEAAAWFACPKRVMEAGRG